MCEWGDGGGNRVSTSSIRVERVPSQQQQPLPITLPHLAHGPKLQYTFKHLLENPHADVTLGDCVDELRLLVLGDDVLTGRWVSSLCMYAGSRGQSSPIQISCTYHNDEGQI